MMTSIAQAAPHALVACPECDRLQRAVALEPHERARCVRCGAELFRCEPDSLDRALAFALAAAILFVPANLFPILGLDIQGHHNAATLLGGAAKLQEQGLWVVAAMVLLTAVVAPMLEIAGMIYVLLPLRLGARLPGTATVFRLVALIRPWGMVEVLMLGVLVSYVKLAKLATVVVGPALWSLAALIVLLSAAISALEPHSVWERLENSR